MRDLEIGIIGLGDMGKLYVTEFAKLGYRVNGSDVPERVEGLKKELKERRIHVLEDGRAVSRRSDIIFYLVETSRIEQAAEQYGPSTKKGAVVSSGLSVMDPAIRAFGKHLPNDVDIINWHWLFGPFANLQGQNSVVSKYRTDQITYEKIKGVFSEVGIKITELTPEEHDRVTADTQVMTHVGFESMGSAWRMMGGYPWENTTYAGGIDTVKVLGCLRVFSGKPHVYSALAMFNPHAREQVEQYALSTRELFSLMIAGKEEKFRGRIEEARRVVFGNRKSARLLDDRILGDFNLGVPAEKRTPNSNLSQFAKVDAYARLGINPYDHMICQTPPFRLALGITEYLFTTPSLLEESNDAALHDLSIRRDDLAFTIAVDQWANIIRNRDELGYNNQFREVKDFFGEEMLMTGRKKSEDLLRKLAIK